MSDIKRNLRFVIYFITIGILLSVIHLNVKVLDYHQEPTEIFYTLNG